MNKMHSDDLLLLPAYMIPLVALPIGGWLNHKWQIDDEILSRGSCTTCECSTRELLM